MPTPLLIEIAQTQDRASPAASGKANAVVDALFRACFEEAKDIGDAAVLNEIAQRCGVNGWPEAIDKAKVVAQEERVRDLGISGVPTFIFDRKSGLSGAYPPDLLAQAIRQAVQP